MVAFSDITSFKNNGQLSHHFWGVCTPLHFENYRIAWEAIGKYVFNSVIVTVISVAGAVLFSLLAAYVFARHTFYGKEVLFIAILSLMMVPGVLTLI